MKPQVPGTKARPTSARYRLTVNMKTVHSLDTRFEDFVEYARLVLDHSPQSILWYRRGYTNFRRYLLEHAELAPRFFDLQLRAIDAWVAWNRARGISRVSVNTYWRSLRMFFRDLEKREAWKNPFHGAKPPGLPAYLPKALDEHACRRILDAAESYPWSTELQRTEAVAVIGVMLYAGLRRGEVLRLRYIDVKVDDGTIRIVRGKGRFGGTDRVAYMPPDLRFILQDYLRARAKLRLVNPELFSTKDGGGLGEMGLRRMMDKVRRASGIDFSPHILRHSFVTHMLKCGIPIQVAKELAGHANIATTMGYLRVWDAQKRVEVKKLHFD